MSSCMLAVGVFPTRFSIILRASQTGALIRSKCITILYRNSPLFIDIFHFIILFLCCFGLFYTVCNFLVPKQQKQDSSVKIGARGDPPGRPPRARREGPWGPGPTSGAPSG